MPRSGAERSLVLLRRKPVLRRVCLSEYGRRRMRLPGRGLRFFPVRRGNRNAVLPERMRILARRLRRLAEYRSLLSLLLRAMRPD